MTKGQRSGSVMGSPRAGGELRGIVAAVSDLGRNRSNNEDNLVIFDLQARTSVPLGPETQFAFAHPGVLLAVADGMGGHSSGQVASQLCVERLPVEFLKVFPASAAAEPERGMALKQAVEATNQVVYASAHENAANKGMGTTLTSAWLVGSRAIVAQVGDSRAYHLHEGSFTQLTRDQTVLNSVSEVERQALLNTPFENMLLQALGAMTQLDVVITTTELAAGDYLLLCSDGLYRVVSPEQMAEVLKGPEPLRKKAENLIQKANDGGGPDNITVILCEVLTRGAAE
ncbi:MAG TPA: protein phosphatase 2C domain-containing protein [Candidatus Acidoferrales bacterium]|nr:protein phosphatase 2C domain-containing protein [Candidatus Acidoferrales bacterium]